MRTTRVLQRGLVVVGIAVLLTAWLATPAECPTRITSRGPDR